MAKIEYVTKNLRAATLAVVEQVNEVVDEYSAQGFTLTLRQIYYQFVIRNMITNSLREYKRLGDIVSDGRLAGLIDWYAIEDRTRFVRDLAHWETPTEIVQSCAAQYRVDRWDREYQDNRPEVWIEKDALIGVISGVCEELDVPYFSCRGYVSQSELWRAARRLSRHQSSGQTPVILHFGDHDPSGIDMTRDIIDRLDMFLCPMEVRRLALNMDQVEEYEPPPNPGKPKDARFQSYVAQFGDECWELDALEPAVLAALVRDEILKLKDDEGWDRATEAITEGRAKIAEVAEQMDDEE